LSIPAKARLMIAAFFPETMHALSSWVARLLPVGDSGVRKTGAESAGEFQEGDRERMYNQRPLHDAYFNLGLKH
jgi:hypothetical protein